MKKNHNIGKTPFTLYGLSLSTFFERFAFYSVALYLVANLNFYYGMSDTQAFTVFGSFMAFSFLTPTIGGYLGDQLIGRKASIGMGLFLIMVGCFLISVNRVQELYSGLGFLAVGNGLFKPNISALITCIYQDHQERLDSAFTVFYAAINAGSAISALLLGYLLKTVGYTNSYLLMGATASLAIVSFLPFVRLNDQKVSCAEAYRYDSVKFLSVGAGSILLSQIISQIIFRGVETVFLLGFFVFIMGYAGYIYARQDVLARKRLIALLFMAVVYMVFCVLYYQAPLSVTLFTKRLVSLDVFGLDLHPAQFLALDPIFVVIFGVILSSLWRVLPETHWLAFAPTKYALGLLVIGIAFFMLIAGCISLEGIHKMNPFWLVMYYFFRSMAELLVIPIGLTIVSKLSPTQHMSFFMGFWFYFEAFANYMAGKLSMISEILDGMSTAKEIGIYTSAFTIYSIIAVFFSIVTIFLIDWLKHLGTINTL